MRGFKALLPVLKEKRERARETGLWAAHYLFNVQAPDAEVNGKLRDVREWIAAADAVLYRAKESGRNRVVRP